MMRIGLVSIYVEDQDKAERFYTQMLGFNVKTSAPYGPDERWLSLVSPEEPEGAELVLHLADAPAQASQQACRQRGRPALSLRTNDFQGEAERLKARGAATLSTFTKTEPSAEIGGPCPNPTTRTTSTW